MNVNDELDEYFKNNLRYYLNVRLKNEDAYKKRNELSNNTILVEIVKIIEDYLQSRSFEIIRNRIWNSHIYFSYNNYENSFFLDYDENFRIFLKYYEKGEYHIDKNNILDGISKKCIEINKRQLQLYLGIKFINNVPTIMIVDDEND